MLKKALLWMAGFVTIAAALVVIAFQVSPWPSALFFRYLFNLGGTASNRALAKHVPPGVSARLNERYDPMEADATFDAFYPSDIGGTERVLPTIVWIHGGGFIGGNKSDVANYLRIVASKGYTTIGVNYSIAPRRIYPTPVRQANAALAFVTRNAKRLHIDPTKLFLAGDSAGAQIAAQLALVISAPRYAVEVGIAPSIARHQLRGVILHCGFYDPHNVSGVVSYSGFVRASGWSYFGTKDFLNDPRTAQFSIVRNIIADFPPMFISVGNADSLEAQSRQLAGAATKLGIEVDSLFFPHDHQPTLPHEYQFKLDLEAGRLALERTMAFLKVRSE